jgi:pimeloyl-ACP methyl ester carboxylesterase
MRSVLLAAVLVVALPLALVWGFQRRLIYLPSPGPVSPAAHVLPGARAVSLETTDGLELGAWFLSGADRRGNIAVLVANGNAGNRAARAPLAEALAAEGFAVLLFDYRGYGGNAGTPTADGLALDVRASYRFLIDEAGVPRDRLVYFGESLGAAVVTELATEHSPAGLVLRSPFVDLVSVGQVHYPFLPVRALLRDRYPVAEQLAGVEVPTTVVYGSEDSIVPPEQSVAVARAAGGPTRTIRIDGANHNDRALLDGEDVVAAVVDTARRAVEDI